MREADITTQFIYNVLPLFGPQHGPGRPIIVVTGWPLRQGKTAVYTNDFPLE